MAWCSHCCKGPEIMRENGQDCFCCPCCGKVLKWPAYRSHHKTRKIENSQEMRGGVANMHKLFDIDDLEVSRYLLGEEEKRLRKTIWEEMNKDYLEVQVAKKAAAAASVLDGTHQVKLTKSKMEKQKQAKNKANSLTPKSCGGTLHGLKRKSISSKINYEVLERMYKYEGNNTKKQQTMSESGEEANNFELSIKEIHRESDEAAVDDAEDLQNDDDDDDDDGSGDVYAHDDDAYYGNVDDGYYEQLDEDYGYDEWDV